jgi:hypothetical protein
MWAKLLMTVAWPAFLAACVLEAAVFALVDPHELSWSGGPLGWSRQAVYTATFFLFWIVSIGACLLALVLSRSGPAPTLDD